jgi:transposase-like protein
MSTKDTQPKTLLEACRYYADLDVCHAYMAKLKWPDGVVICPKCKGNEIGDIKSRRMYQCKNVKCRKQFSVKVGTIFEDSPLSLDKWFVAVWSITNAKNGISSCELARALGITQKSAWHMLHRVRKAMHIGSFDRFTGEVESDESYIGGRAENMHASRRRRAVGPGGVGKSVVHGLLERGSDKASRVIAGPVPDAKERTILPILYKAIEPHSVLYTDSATAYRSLNATGDFVHLMVDHTREYVRGRSHTNSIENFWSLLKRTIKGTYVSVDSQHLGKYVDEQVFRFNERKLSDASRFGAIMPGVVGKRLTYKELIGAIPRIPSSMV